MSGTRARLIVLLAVLGVGFAAWVGADVAGHLANGGYVASSAESERAERVLRETFGVERPNMLLHVTAPADEPAVVRAGSDLTRRLEALPGVVSAHSYWSAGDPRLKSPGGGSAIVALRLGGDENAAQRTARQIVRDFVGRHGPLAIAATGEAPGNAEALDQGDADLVTAELTAAPMILLILLLVFRTPLAALLPFVVGVVSVVSTMAVLRIVAEFTEVSTFALNITTLLGFGLAIDYSLFVLVRHREDGDVRSAARTVLFSAVTVAISVSALLIFPLYFLSSLAIAAIPVVLIAGLTAVTVLPALVVLCGQWLERGDISRFLPRSAKGPVWGRLAALIMRRPVSWAVPVVLGLLFLAIPFGHAKFGLTDERILPPDSPVRATAVAIEREFGRASFDPLTAVLIGVSDPGPYIALQREPGVSNVDVERRGDVHRVSVALSVPPYSNEGERLARKLSELRPASGEVLRTGPSVAFAHTKDVIAERIPYALALICVAMFVLLFLFTGGLLVAVKALLFGALSLTASFGAMVFVFQDGNLAWLVGDFTATGYLDVTVPVLMFCVAFGLSMDYEVFLLARIREEYLATGDNARAVVAGLAKTGSVISSAALLIGVVLLALVTSEMSVLKLLGLGLFLAVLVDAVLVRGVLVPAFMKIAGRANWWAPPLLRRVHARLGIKENQ
ncbi:MMPL family transporter [Allokutzneria sp. A3M-2-11 16]|uniref:MMPL family transporter n=1 Tax=Allokutzneria sp. A3M-2-11 16 TaxID=2962043 RepID=UPI0020B7017B|nr:MMPL family transporter [Allokutzneria sp. A3M-2-11 16]MCP3798701.1 MMPL family transporter [Allokutzneria sp. A3M-2-11 16]